MLELQNGKLGEKPVWLVGTLEEASVPANETWVKWGVHHPDDNSDAPDGKGPPGKWKRVSGHQVSILIDGKITIWAKRPAPSDEEKAPIELTKKGRWVAIPDGWRHKWRIPKDGHDVTRVITVRWKPDLLDVFGDMRTLCEG